MGELLTLSPEHLVPVLVEAEVDVRAVGLPLDEELLKLKKINTSTPPSLYRR